MNPTTFIHDLTWEQIPDDVRVQAKRCLLDTIGVAIGGRQTELSRIIYNHAVRAFGGGDVQLWFDGRSTSMVGAVLAHGMSIDALDLHDSHRLVKGHAGVAQVPAALATLGLGKGKVSGKELLTTLVMAYDIATRTGTAQHATVCDYHTSGSWNAVGCAAVVARRMGLSHEQTRHALGIAEYHGPRSQMMRAIDYPTMIKDGSGWGAMAGVSAGLLAADGFTGAPAITVEADNAAEYWQTLGDEWQIMTHYFKPYAVCYWAQPALAGAMQIVSENQIHHSQISAIRIYTFHESSRLAMRRPTKTDEAQYSLPFPLGALLVHGRLYLDELNGDNLHHPHVLRISDMVELIDDDYFNDRFPAERLSRVEIDTNDGRSFDSGVVRPLWDLTAQASNEELLTKFRELAHQYLPASEADALEAMLWGIEDVADVAELNRILCACVSE